MSTPPKGSFTGSGEVYNLAAREYLGQKQTTMNATLNKTEYAVKFNYATFFEYEERFGKTLLDVTTQRAVLELYYCTLIANNEDFIADYPDFKAFLAALEGDGSNTVEAVCTKAYVLYCEGLKKKLLQSHPNSPNPPTPSR